MHKVEKASSPPPPSITAVHHSASVIVRSDAAWHKEDKKAGLKCSMQTPTAEVQQKKTMWHVSSPLMAEGLAIREALVYCRNQGLYSIYLESDSSQMIKAINQREPITELHGILSDILKQSSSPSFFFSLGFLGTKVLLLIPQQKKLYAWLRRL